MKNLVLPKTSTVYQDLKDHPLEIKQRCISVLAACYVTLHLIIIVFGDFSQIKDSGTILEQAQITLDWVGLSIQGNQG